MPDPAPVTVGITRRHELFFQIGDLRKDMDLLAQRIGGLGFTPKHLRKQRREAFVADLRAKAEEHDKLVDEFNALLPSR